MKQVTVTGPRQVEIVERPDPRAKGDYVVVKNIAAPMCTEYKAYRDNRTAENLGHEAAGEVVEVAQPGRVRVGQRVVVMPVDACGTCPLCLAGEYIHCRHPVDVRQVTGNAAGTATYAQYLVKADWQLVPIPDGLSYEHAGMACCGLGPTFQAMQRMNVSGLDTVLVTGLGPVGLGGVINAVYRGARVIGVEGHAYRAALARELGAETVIDPAAPDALKQIMDLTDGRGVDAAVDCSGAREAQRLMIDAARRRGQVAFVGEAGDLTINVSDDTIRKGLTLHGVWHYPLGDAPAVMDVIRRSPGPMDQLITHTFPMTGVRDAWELQLTGACGKVVLHPWDAA
ncbi:MAG TPA: zinc-binding dehydrogenase [Phycisphaerae bacterium]|nr:zinc-binding dehydrogenase [Phycisphaerae bacterium]